MDEVDFLLDTDVVIELMREVDDVVAWAGAHRDKAIGMSMLVRAEVLAGAGSRQEQDEIHRELRKYATIHIAPVDSRQAVEWFEQFHLSHGLGIVDCLIAASSVRLGKPLYTFNMKHFRAIPGLDAAAPCERT